MCKVEIKKKKVKMSLFSELLPGRSHSRRPPKYTTDVIKKSAVALRSQTDTTAVCASSEAFLGTAWEQWKTFVQQHHGL